MKHKILPGCFFLCPVLVLMLCTAGASEVTAQTITFGPGDVSGERVVPLPNLASPVIRFGQLPNQNSCTFSDPDFDVIIAEDFDLTLAGFVTISQIVVWGVYLLPGPPPATDNFRVIFHAHDIGTDLPGILFSDESNVPSSRIDTGLDLGALDEYQYTLTLQNPVSLPPGRYWVAINNHVSTDPDDEWCWENGSQAAQSLAGSAADPFGNVPGTTWSMDPDSKAILLIEGTLPVELTRFTAVGSNDGRITLEWTTASETNNAGFEVQLSSDGNTFVPVGFVEGAGTTTEAQHYRYTVDALTPGKQFIRLKQIDLDGTFEFSNIIETETEVPDGFVLMPAYPNPFNPRTTVQFVVERQQPVRAVLYNSLGIPVRVLYDGIAPANQAETILVDGTDLASGLYVVQLEGAVQRAITKILLTK